MNCKFCGSEVVSHNAVRMGACWMCIEIESIIIDGEEMDTNFTKNVHKSCVTKDEKINMVNKHYPSENAEYWYSYHIKRLRKMKLNKIENE